MIFSSQNTFQPPTLLLNDFRLTRVSTSHSQLYFLPKKKVEATTTIKSITFISISYVLCAFAVARSQALATRRIRIIHLRCGKNVQRLFFLFSSMAFHMREEDEKRSSSARRVHAHVPSETILFQSHFKCARNFIMCSFFSCLYSIEIESREFMRTPYSTSSIFFFFLDKSTVYTKHIYRTCMDFRYTRC